MSACDRYDLAEEQIKAFSRSGIRAKIMFCLKDGNKTSSEMERIIGARTSTILHATKEMIEADLVRRTASGFALTNIGMIEALLLDDLVSSIAILDKHKEFWLAHDLRSIPIALQKEVGMLAQSEIISSDSAALLKSHEHFVEKLGQAKEIRGVSPIIIPGHSEVISAAIKYGAEVELILTDKILQIAAEEYRDLGSELLKQDNFKLYHLNEDIKVAFTVTDTMLSLGLYRLDGGYDLGRDLICIGAQANSWGRKLFEHYRNKSKLIKMI